MNKLFYLLIPLICANIWLSSWWARNGEVNFHTDIARDFLLFSEITAKKIILIGPRSSTSGIYHGPLWLYLNYPAYYLGQGDPVTVAWFWLLLVVLFVASSYFLATRVFDRKVGLVYALFLSANLVFQTNSLFNPHGALFCLPAFLFTLILYQKTGSWKYLLPHLFLGGLITQFQMAVGIPLVAISAGFIIFKVFASARYSQLLAFFLLPLTLINYFIFEVRHGFNMSKAILNYAAPAGYNRLVIYWQMALERLDKATQLQLTDGISYSLNGVIFGFVCVLTYIEIKRKSKYASVFLTLVIFHFGYILLTFVNKGIILYHQIFPMLAVSNLWVALLMTSRYKKFLFGLIIFVMFLHFNQAGYYLDQSRDNFKSSHFNSWRFLASIGTQIAAAQTGRPFGYFVYSPDAFAYQPRYALQHIFNKTGAKAAEFQKEPITYVISAPPPPDNPYMKSSWWIENRLNIHAPPDFTDNYSNGYSVAQYHLTESQLAAPWDKVINVGVHFR